jgi:peptide methionine sulfoxide reductase MsrB
MQQQGKHVSAATDTDTRIEDTVFSMWSTLRLYSEDQQQQQFSTIMRYKQAVAVCGWPRGIFTVGRHYLTPTSDNKIKTRRLRVCCTSSYSQSV